MTLASSWYPYFIRPYDKTTFKLTQMGPRQLEYGLIMLALE